MANFFDTSSDIKSFLTFRLGEEVFACHVNKLLSILEIPQITDVPGSPSYMKGIIDLRGKVLPVIDTKLKLNMPAIEFNKDTCIIVMDINLDNNNLLVGILVDAVIEVMEFDEDKILPPPNLGSKYHSEFINGIVKKDDKFIMLVDIDKVFSLDEIDFLKGAVEFEEETKDKEEDKEKTKEEKTEKVEKNKKE
jgi:purine-binding chemotaxis protein CheW